MSARSGVLLIVGVWLAVGCRPEGEVPGRTDASPAARELARIWNERDSAAIAELYADDAVFRDVAFGVEQRGTAAIEALFHQTWEGLPDLRTELRTVVADGERAAAEWTLTGTHEGDFPDLPATGRRVNIRGVSVLQVRAGQIVRQRDYYDRAAFLEQLGVSPTAGDRR